MEDVQLNPNQKKVVPNVVALGGALIGFIGLLTPWISVGGSGLSGSSSTQGRLTYFVILSLIFLGLSVFIARLRRFIRIISLLCIVICTEVLVSFGMWLFQALKAIHEFNDSVGKLDNLGGLFGDALANITKTIKPSITTGFYMVLAAALIGLVTGLIVYFNSLADINSDEPSEKSILNLSKVQTISGSVVAALSLVAIVALSGNSNLGNSLDLGSEGSGSTSNAHKSASSSVFNCLKVTNVANAIKLNQPSFSGDPDPTDIFVATKLRITNKCGKSIVGIKGSVDFQNVVGDTIFTGGFTDDNTILSGESFTTSLNTGWTFNEFEDEYGLLGGMDQTKTKAILVLTKVAFEDGTMLTE